MDEYRRRKSWKQREEEEEKKPFTDYIDAQAYTTRVYII